MALRRETGRESHFHDRGISVTQEIPGAFDSPRQHILMRRLTDGGFERTRQIERADFYFSRHGLKAEVTVEVFLDKLDQAPNFPRRDRPCFWHAGWPRS